MIPSSTHLDGAQADPRSRNRTAAIGWFLVLTAFFLRLFDALGASLHLDDFHSLHHARAETWSTFFQVLSQDNHPPLSFVVLRGLRSLGGEGEFLLRLPNVLYGTAAVALTWRLSRRFKELAPRILGTGLLAVSSLHLNLSSDLRMYALLGLAVLGVVDALLDRLQPVNANGSRDTSGFRLGAWIAIALLTHYHALHAAAVLGLSYGFLLLIGRSSIQALRRVWLPVLIGCLIALPWYATGFRTQLGHELAPGGSRVSPSILGEAFVHLIYFRMDPLDALRPVLVVLGMLCLPLAVLGFLRLLGAAKRSDNSWELPFFLGALAFGLPVWTAMIALIQPRAGFEWRYLAASIAPYCLLIGSGAAGVSAFAKVRRTLVVLCLLAAAGLSGAHVLDPGREDYSSAADYILEQAQPGDGVLGVEWQPRLFPHGGGWHYYAKERGAGRAERLVNLEHTPDFQLEDEARVQGLGRVFCLLRSIPNDVPLLQRLRALFPHEEKAQFGEGIWVLTFSK